MAVWKNHEQNYGILLRTHPMLRSNRHKLPSCFLTFHCEVVVACRESIFELFHFHQPSSQGFISIPNMEVHPNVISAADLQEDGMDTQMEDDVGRPSFPAISAVDAQASLLPLSFSTRER